MGFGNKKIKPEEVRALLDQGLNPGQIAKQLQVSPSAISKVFVRNQEVFLGVRAQDVVLRTAQKVADAKLDAMGQLLKINRLAHRELDFISKAMKEATTEARRDLEPRQLNYIAELRKQLTLALDVAQSLYGIEETAAFQRIVLEEIESINPEAKARIMERLRERRSAKNLIKGKG
jgi:predicted transcriptional regulator